MLWHMADAGQGGQHRVGQLRRCDCRVDIQRDDSVCGAVDQLDRHGQRIIFRDHLLDLGQQRVHLLRIGAHRHPAQGQAGADVVTIAVRRVLRGKDRADAGAHKSLRHKGGDQRDHNTRPKGRTGDLVLPAKITFPRLGHGGYEHQPRRVIGPRQPPRQRHRAAIAVPQDDRVAHPKPVRCLLQQRGLFMGCGRRSIPCARVLGQVVGPAEPRTVEQDNAVAVGKLVHHIKGEIPHIP